MVNQCLMDELVIYREESFFIRLVNRPVQKKKHFFQENNSLKTSLKYFWISIYGGPYISSTICGRTTSPSSERTRSSADINEYIILRLEIAYGRNLVTWKPIHKILLHFLLFRRVRRGSRASGAASETINPVAPIAQPKFIADDKLFRGWQHLSRGRIGIKN